MVVRCHEDADCVLCWEGRDGSARSSSMFDGQSEQLGGARGDVEKRNEPGASAGIVPENGLVGDDFQNIYGRDSLPDNHSFLVMRDKVRGTMVLLTEWAPRWPSAAENQASSVPLKWECVLNRWLTRRKVVRGPSRRVSGACRGSRELGPNTNSHGQVLLQWCICSGGADKASPKSPEPQLETGYPSLQRR